MLIQMILPAFFELEYDPLGLGHLLQQKIHRICLKILNNSFLKIFFVQGCAPPGRRQRISKEGATRASNW